MDDFATLAGLVAVATQATTLVKYLAAREAAKAVQVMIPWVVVFAVLALGAQADQFQGLALPGLDVVLGVADMATLLLYSVAVGSTGGLTYKTLTAVDNGDSAREPSLGVDRPLQ